MHLKKLVLQLTPVKYFEVVNNESDPRYKEYWSEYYQIIKRCGVPQELRALIAAIMLHRGKADAMLCGIMGSYLEHFEVVKNVFALSAGAGERR